MVNTHVGEAKGTKIINIRLVVRPSLMMIKAESNDKSRLFQVQSEPGAKHRSSNCDLRAALLYFKI